jgi:hypothetical protein
LCSQMHHNLAVCTLAGLSCAKVVSAVQKLTCSHATAANTTPHAALLQTYGDEESIKEYAAAEQREEMAAARRVQALQDFAQHQQVGAALTAHTMTMQICPHVSLCSPALDLDKVPATAVQLSHTWFGPCCRKWSSLGHNTPDCRPPNASSRAPHASSPSNGGRWVQLGSSWWGVL